MRTGLFLSPYKKIDNKRERKYFIHHLKILHLLYLILLIHYKYMQKKNGNLNPFQVPNQALILKRTVSN